MKKWLDLLRRLVGKFRLTSINAFGFGASWEYKDKNKQNVFSTVRTNFKIKVFVSSIYGKEKYDKIRMDLKRAIERTGLAEVYLYEDNGASTLSANDDHIYKLRDADVCIFLIDNEDGVNEGAQREIDAAERYHKKSLCYFCNEHNKEETELQKSLMGSKYLNFKLINSFSELSDNGAKDLIENILLIYHYYCFEMITIPENKDEIIQLLEAKGMEKYQLPLIPKVVLKNLDKCTNYILNFIMNRQIDLSYLGEEKTSDLDEWGVQFLSVLFEGISIRNFNTALYLDLLKSDQGNEYHELVRIRWKAIQAYFYDDLETCITKLKEALHFAKRTKQPAWIINDILIDLINVQRRSDKTKRDCFVDTQEELIKSKEEINYPIIDRIDKELNNKYVNDMYQDKTKGPCTVTFGGGVRYYAELIADAFVIAMFNGSLSHLLQIYKRIKDCLIVLSSEYDQWSFNYNLYKLEIFNSDEKRVRGLENSYPSILNKIDSIEAKSILIFCENCPLKEQRLLKQMLAFSSVGYFLEDEDFKKYKNIFFNEIKNWLNSGDPFEDKLIIVFKFLSGIALRISQEELSEVCCLVIEKNLVDLYSEMIRFLEDHIDIPKMCEDSKRKLIEHINILLERADKQDLGDNNLVRLCSLQSQDFNFAESMEKIIADKFTDFYENTYKLEFSGNRSSNSTLTVKKYIDSIKLNNEQQGMNGEYKLAGSRDIIILKNFLKENIVDLDLKNMRYLISTVTDTILYAKETVETKFKAVSLLICVVVKYPESYLKNKDLFDKLFEQQSDIRTLDIPILLTSVDNIALEFSLQLLFVAIGKGVYKKILELMPYIQDKPSMAGYVSKLIAEYLWESDDLLLPSRIEMIVLQNTLQWINSEHIGIRQNATLILIAMSRNPENVCLVNSQLINLIDNNGRHIKNLMLRYIHKAQGITNETREYIVSKCRFDADFTVRKTCADIENEGIDFE